MSGRRQAWQFAAALVFFHGSEYVLAAAFHGRQNVTATCECTMTSCLLRFECALDCVLVKFGGFETGLMQILNLE